MTSDQRDELAAFRCRCLMYAASLTDKTPNSLAENTAWQMVLWSVIHFTDSLAETIAEHEDSIQ